MSGRRFIALLVAGCAVVAGQAVLAHQRASALAAGSSRVGTITNGVAWNDTAGNYITAHLGSTFQTTSNGVTNYYWCGINWNSADSSPSSAAHGFQGVQCYGSTDLATWTYTGAPALAVDPNNPMLNSSRNIERPKVIYNAGTGKYVMWFHDDNAPYTEYKFGVATASNPAGPYTWVNDPKGDGLRNCYSGTGDLSLFQDGSTAYVVHTTSLNADIVIEQLDATYTSCVATIASGLGGSREAPQLIKVNGRYFLFTSQTHWWGASQGAYRSSTSLSTGWTANANFGSRITAYSQGADVIPVAGAFGTTYVMLADRLQGYYAGDKHWNVNQSQYVMLPLRFDGQLARMDYLNSWSIDTSTGLWSTTDPQPCDLTQQVDSETGLAEDSNVTGSPGAFATTGGSWGVAASQFPTGNATNKVYQHSTSESSYAIQNASDPLTYTDSYVQSYVAIDTSSASEASVAGRANQSDLNHFYTFALSSQGWAIRLNNGGIWTTLASGTQFPGKGGPNWYLMRLLMQGNVLTALLSLDDGRTFTQLGTTTDSTLTSGTFGVGSSGGLVSFDSITACVIDQANPMPRPNGVTLMGGNRGLSNSAGTQCATAGTANGSNVALSACASAGRWTWEQFPENTTGPGRIVSGNEMCMDVANAVLFAGASVVVGTCSNLSTTSDSQRWIVDDAGGGSFRLRNSVVTATGSLCISAGAGNATLAACSTTDASQKFRTV